MAKKQSRDMNEMAKTKEDFETLQADKNVHCILDEHGRFHTVIFKTSHREEWLRVIEHSFGSRLCYQMTKKCGEKDIYTFSMSGPEDELRRFHKAFDQMFEEVMKKCGGAAAQRNQQGIFHMVKFKPYYPELWMRKIQNYITTNPSLLAREYGVKGNITIKLSGPADEVKRFLDGLVKMREEVKKIIKDNERAAAQGNPEDDVEQLEEKVSDLKIGNKTQKK